MKGENFLSSRGETSLRLPLVENFLPEADLSYFSCDGFSSPRTKRTKVFAPVRVNLLRHRRDDDFVPRDRRSERIDFFYSRSASSYRTYYYYTVTITITNCYYCQNGKGAIGSTRRIQSSHRSSRGKDKKRLTTIGRGCCVYLSKDNLLLD